MARSITSPAKAPPPTETATYEFTLSVLGYREEGEWVALALEVDLRGFGSTFHEAVEDLRDLVRMQVSFAHYKGQPEMVWKPAEGVWWGLFLQVRRDFLEASVRERQPADDDYSIAGIRIPAAHEIASFSRADT
jgi:hypothetical protein